MSNPLFSLYQQNMFMDAMEILGMYSILLQYCNIYIEQVSTVVKF